MSGLQPWSKSPEDAMTYPVKRRQGHVCLQACLCTPAHAAVCLSKLPANSQCSPLGYLFLAVLLRGRKAKCFPVPPFFLGHAQHHTEINTVLISLRHPAYGRVRNLTALLVILEQKELAHLKGCRSRNSTRGWRQSMVAQRSPLWVRLKTLGREALNCGRARAVQQCGKARALQRKLFCSLFQYWARHPDLGMH